MRPLGAVVVGIGAYRYDHMQFPVLRFASNDADEFFGYLATCWPKSDSKLIRIADEDATANAITKAFVTLGQDGPYDLLVVFLSGHGWVNSESSGFVVQPVAGSASLSLLDNACLDQLLRSVAAKLTILILDCCYAEGITRKMSFFSSLGESDARLFVASSREQQLTWEDEQVGHGIFTAHLLDLLRTGNSAKLNSVRDQLDVDSELFPVLCDQVPLYVLEHKQQRQEPVKGGVSMRAVTLPVARAARRIKERTAFGTAVVRLRQIFVGAATAVTVFLFFAYTLGYYAQADRSGDIRLHHGAKWLAPVFRFLPTLRTDTGISSTDLSKDPASRYAVLAGEMSGFWTHISRQGYRAWYDTVRPSLEPKAAERYDVLLGIGAMPLVYRLNDESRPSEIALAAWALLDNSDSNEFNALLGHVLGANRTVPLLAAFSPNDLDFNTLDLTQPELSSFADALRYVAAVDPDRAFIPYLGFLKANQSWLAHSSSEQHGNEAQRRATEDVADVLAVITKARIDQGKPALDATMRSLLDQLAELGYGNLVHLALSRITATPADKKSAVARAFSAFHGNSSEPAEAAAIRQLKDSLDSSAFSREIVAETYNRFVAVGGPEQSDLTAFLIAAADRKALPPSVIAILLNKARQAIARHGSEFIDSEYARILAHGMSQIPLVSRPLAYQLIDMVVALTTPKASGTAEMYTALARQKLDKPVMLQQIVAQASTAPPYQPENPDLVAEPLPGLSIVVGYGPWLEALAIVGGDRSLGQQAINVLEQHANDPSVHDVVIRALVRQPTLINQQCWKSSCSTPLEALPKDWGKRQLMSDILAEQLAGLPHREFLIALEELRKNRATEVEPEVRIALGLIIINARLARMRTTPIGSRLFE